MQDKVIKMLMSKGRVYCAYETTKFGIDVMLDIVNHNKKRAYDVTVS
jgi:hypothetical protein